MGSSNLIFDNRPEPLSQGVLKAMQIGMSTELDWSNGHLSHDPLPNLLQEFEVNLKALLNMPANFRVLLTSSVFESINSAIKGVAWSIEGERDEIAIVRGDQGGFAEAAAWCVRLGFKIVYLPLTSDGEADLDKWSRLISKKTAIVGISSVTPEVHTKRKIYEIVSLCRANSAISVIDMTEQCSAEIVNLGTITPDIVCIDGTAIGGPTGVAILAISPHFRFAPMISGDLFQDALRSGRINLSLMLGFSSALDEYADSLSKKKHIKRDLYRITVRKINRNMNSARIISSRMSLFTGLLILVPEVEGEALVLALESKKIYVTTGSSCSGSAGKPSQTLTEMGFSDKEVSGAIHMAFRADHSEDDILHAIRIIDKTVQQLWQISGYSG